MQTKSPAVTAFRALLDTGLFFFITALFAVCFTVAAAVLEVFGMPSWVGMIAIFGGSPFFAYRAVSK